MRPLSVARLVCFLVLSWCGAAWAQVAATDGAIEGRVRTEAGLPLGGARVEATHVQTGLTRSTDADADGRYRLPLLPPGEYALVVTVEQRAVAIGEGILVEPGESVPTEVIVPSLTATASVMVTAERPAADPTRTVMRHVLDGRVLRDVPTLGRSVLELFTVQPGINARPLPTTGSGTAMPVMTHGGLSVRQINVDGVTNTLQGGARNVMISQEAIEQVDTLTHFTAEFGRVAGALQNIVTRSGTLTPRGSAFLFVRHKVLSAQPHLLRPGERAPDFSRYNLGATAGGPIWRDRLVGFVSYERWMQDNPVVVTIDPAHAQVLGIDAADIGTRTATYRAHTLTGRVDAALTDTHRLVGRVNYYHNRQSPLQGGLQTRRVATRFDESPHSLTGQLVSVLGRRAVNELRLHHVRRRISNGLDANPAAPNITVSGIASFNGNANGHRVTTEEGWQVIENVTVAAGRHAIKAGVELLAVAFEETARNVNGTFVFGGLPPVPRIRAAVSPIDQFLAAEAGNIDPATGQPFAYSRFTQVVGPAQVRSASLHRGYFVQDDVRLWRLRLSAGVRYERFTRPGGQINPALPATGTIPEDRDNIAPRLSAAFDVGGDGSLVARAGWGRYFNPVAVETYNQYALGNGMTSTAITVSPTDASAPAFTRGRVEPLSARGAVSDVFVFDPAFEDLEVSSWFATLERALGPRTSAALTVLGTGARHLPLSLNVNLAPAGSGPDGRRRWTRAGRPVPAFGNIFVAHAIGESRYRGLLATATRRAADGLWMQVGYHLSRTTGIGYTADTAGFGILTVPSDPLDPSVDRGPGDFDMRQRLTAVVLYPVRAPGRWWSGWDLSARAVVSDGFRLNALTGADDNVDTQFNDRPPGIGYNAFTLPGYVSVDVRVARRFALGGGRTLEAIGELFNATNHLNATTVNAVWGQGAAPAPSFGQPLQAEAARQGQIGLRVTF